MKDDHVLIIADVPNLEPCCSQQALGCQIAHVHFPATRHGDFYLHQLMILFKVKL